MELILNDGTKVAVSNLKFGQWREFMQEYLASAKSSAKAWDLMSALRGPDTPSEKESMEYSVHQETYRARRTRKYETTEAIREAAFYGTVGGSARYHKADFVTVPPSAEQDHFDRHIVRAALVLGLNVKTKETK